MKEEGKTSKAPLSEAFGQWKNAKIALIALFGLTMGQAVVWYTGQFYALFFLQNVLKVENQSANIMVASALVIGTGFFVVLAGSRIRLAASRSSWQACFSQRSPTSRCLKH